MSKKSNSLLQIATALINMVSLITLLSCTSINEGVILKNDSYAKIQFTGDVVGAKITIDNGEEIVLDKTNVVYKLKAGTHSIRVFKNNQLVIHRNSFFDNNTITEIELP
jgi:hypothetical protein